VKLLIKIVLFFLIIYDATAKSQFEISVSPTKIYQGDIFELFIKSKSDIENITLDYIEKNIPCFKIDNDFSCLIGVDLETKPDNYKIKLNFDLKSGVKLIEEIKIKIRKKNFKVSIFTVPKEKDTFTPELLAQIKKEEKEILDIFKNINSQKYWDKPFVKPVTTIVKANFGDKRIINNEPRNPHSGIDFKGDIGMPVKAVNNGNVKLIGNYFFSGNTIIIDHGLGLYSMYFHLNKFNSNLGDIIKKGDIIGYVGATGRATGPHLHFGLRLNNSRVDPLKIFEIK
jgi:murein DD-endopeptidase MepM/ murein hydrolase activator NlpD